MNSFILVSMLALVQPTTQPVAPAARVAPTPATMPGESQPAGVELARRIHAAHGGDLWNSVRRLRYTFNVESDGKLALSAAHDWDVRTGEVTVSVGEKSLRTNVYANAPRTGDEQAAFGRWTNDSYWLLMPLKLLDPGVIHAAPVPVSRDMPPSIVSLTISFRSVGLTPGDQYDLRIDTQQNRIVHFTYRPNPDRQIGFTWDDYQDFNGLLLSTQHVSDDGKRRIFFTDVVVERD